MNTFLKMKIKKIPGNYLSLILPSLLILALFSCSPGEFNGSSKGILPNQSKDKKSTKNSSSTTEESSTSNIEDSEQAEEATDITGAFLYVGPVIGAENDGDSILYGFVLKQNDKKLEGTVQSYKVGYNDPNNNFTYTELIGCQIASPEEDWHVTCPVPKTLYGISIEFVASIDLGNGVITPEAKSNVVGIPNCLDGYPICGGEDSSCYLNTEAKAKEYACTPSGKVLEYTELKIWKEKDKKRVLQANGLDGWQKKLNFTGKGRSADDFTAWSEIEGRVCPPDVYVDDKHKFAANECLYYGKTHYNEALNAAGVSQTDSATLGLSVWSRYNNGDPKWFVGNIKICADLGMRLPTLYETNSSAPELYTPTIDGSPDYAGPLGVPSTSNYACTASSHTEGTDNSYWNWRGVYPNPINPDDLVNIICVVE